MTNTDLTFRDRLALERTKLANERTFLAYFRTSLGFLGGGIGIISIHFFREVEILGYILVVLSPIILAYGIFRFLKVRKNIKEY